jgi:uncharacterized protein YbjT (DUF2867 family)
MAIVITGASGQLGRLAAERALEHIEPGQLLLVTRHVEALEDFSAPGAVVRPGSFDDPARVRHRDVARLPRAGEHGGARPHRP